VNTEELPKADLVSRPGVGGLAADASSPRYALYLLVLGAIWGSSYLFLKVGVRDLSPPDLIEIRLLCATPLLLAFVVSRYGWAPLRSAWRVGIVLGALNAAIPFTLIAWGEKWIDSGTAAVANSSVPIFVAILAVWVAPGERSTGWRLVGIVLGLVGVGILAGVHPEGGWHGVLGIGAITLASISYAAANLFAAKQMVHGGPVLAAASVCSALVLLLPFALASLPSATPGWRSVGAGVVLGVLATAVAQVIAYRVVRLYGSSRAVLVAYLMPPFGLLYGTAFLGESLSVQKVAGLALILGGVALGAGALRLPRREPVVQTP
jgi:drug/metabolite transporter (DMT)-like permease